MAFSETADVVKLTDEEAEWLLGIPGDEALENPSALTSYFPSAEVRRLIEGGPWFALLIGR